MTGEIFKLIEKRERSYRAKRKHPRSDYLKKKHLQLRRDVKNAISRRKLEYKSISRNSTVSSSSNNNTTVSLTNPSPSCSSSSFANRGNEIVVPASSTIPDVDSGRDNELKKNLAIMALLL